MTKSSLRVPSLAFVFDRKHVSSRERAGVVELRVTYMRRQKYMSTGVRVCAHEWRNNSVVNRGDAVELNRVLEKLRRNVLAVINSMIDEGVIELDAIVSRVSLRVEGLTFIDYVERRARARGVRESTRRHYMVFVRFLRSWGGIVYFSDVSASSVRAMNEQLQHRGLLKSTISNYNKWLKLFINDALTDGYVRENPYVTHGIRVERGGGGQIECLSRQQVAALECLELSSTALVHARDLFLFQCYTGLAYSDLMLFDASQLFCVDGGVLCGEFRRHKTGTPYTICIMERAAAILRKYDNSLPRMSNQKYNLFLKVIGAAIGCSHLHSHMGRSTFATLMLNGGVSVDVLQHMVGHRDRSQTQRYATMLRETIVRAFCEVSNLS